MHLGMSGRFVVTRDGATKMPGEFQFTGMGGNAHDHVVLHLSNGTWVTYNDARRFGFMDLVPRAEIGTCRHFAGMGIEPLGNALSGETIAALFRNWRTALKAASSTSGSSPASAISMSARRSSAPASTCRPRRAPSPPEPAA